MRHVWLVSPCSISWGIGHPLWCVKVKASPSHQLSPVQCPSACPCKGSSSSSSSRDCETLLIVSRSCLGSTLGPSPPAATVEMTEPEPVLSVACHCRCGCQCRPNRRITCSECHRGVGPGCCARNARGEPPDVGATTCICHICLEYGPPPLPNPQEEKELHQTLLSTHSAAICLASRRGEAAMF